jgi:Glutaminase
VDTSSRFVATGTLPARDAVQELVAEAYQRYRAESRGNVSTVYPALAAADPDRLGICVASVDGTTRPVDDAHTEFTIMSVAKPFVFALVAEAMGGAGTGRRQRDRAAVQLDRGGRAERGPDQSDGERRCARHDRPRARRFRDGTVGVHSRRALPVRRTRLAASIR